MRRILIATILLAAPALTFAQGYGQGRGKDWDFGISAIYQQGDAPPGLNGSSLDVDDSWGLGFNFTYNFTSKLALGADLDFIRPDYTAILASENDPNDTIRINHTMSQFNGRIKGTFNLLDGPLTPFVELGAGWSYIDSNVANGPPVTGCWWHPWWGIPICSNFYNTFSTTETTYGGGLGVRYEFRGGSFIKLSYNVWDLDTGGGSADPRFTSGRFEYGWNF